MVQIMSNSGQSSRNRAERASLDGTAAVPLSTENPTATLVIHSDIGEAHVPPEANPKSPTLTTAPTPRSLPAIDEFEEEDYESAGQHLFSSTMSKETNNNMSESNQDCGMVVDPWGATSSYVSPRSFDDEDDNDLQVDHRTVGSRHRQFHQNQNQHRRRRGSKGSSSSCSSRNKSSKSRSESGGSSTSSIIGGIQKRRGSNSSCSTSTSSRNKVTTENTIDTMKQESEGLKVEKFTPENQESKDNFQPPSDTKHIPNPVVKKSGSTSSSSSASNTNTIPYCYRCYLRFPSNAKWREHAVYKHILTKNPYPIVEMNYIDPLSLQFGLAIESEETSGRSDMPAIASDLDDVFTYNNDSNVGVENIPPNQPMLDLMPVDKQPEPVTNNATNRNSGPEQGLPKEHLRLRIGKEKGTYIVKQTSCSSSSTNAVIAGGDSLSSPPPSLGPVFNNALPSAQDNANTPGPVVMPVLQLYGNRTPPPSSKKTGSDDVKTGVDTSIRTTDSVGSIPRRENMSIESELASDFIDAEFEKALELATELSRVGQSHLTGSKDNDDSNGDVEAVTGVTTHAMRTRSSNAHAQPSLKPIPGAGGGVAVEVPQATPSAVETPIRMISEEVPTQVATENKTLSEEPPPNSPKETEVAPDTPPLPLQSEVEEKVNEDTDGIQIHDRSSKDAQTLGKSSVPKISIRTPQCVFSMEKDHDSSSNNSEGEYNLKIVENGVPSGTDSGNIPKESEAQDESSALNDNSNSNDSTSKSGTSKSPKDVENENLSEEEVLNEKALDDTATASNEDQIERQSDKDEHEAVSPGANSDPEVEGIEPNTESDDCECQVCHKVFLSDQELNDHFSKDHFRLAGGVGILEPESPYPPSVGGQSIFTDAEDETDPHGPPVQSQPSFVRSIQEHVRRQSTEQLLPPPYGRVDGEEGQSILLRNHIMGNNSSMNYNRPPGMLHQQSQSQPRAYLHPQGNRPMTIQHHRISSPNMVSGMLNQPRPPGRPALIVHHPQLTTMGGQGPHPPNLSQRPVLQRQPPPHYPISLHNALTAPQNQPHSQVNNSYGNRSMEMARGHAISNRPPLRPIIQSHPQYPNQNQPQRPNQGMPQQQNIRPGGMPQIRGPHPQQHINMSQTVGMQFSNHMNAERAQQQSINQLQHQQRQQQMLAMPRLQQIPQQQQNMRHSSMQITRHQLPPPPQGRNPSPHPSQIQVQAPNLANQQNPQKRNLSMAEINEIRGNKQPRIDNPPSAEITIGPRTYTLNSNGRSEVRDPNSILSMPSLDANVAAAIGSVGNSGVNSVRLGNAITLSVCPTNSSDARSVHSQNSPAHSPALSDSRNSSGSSSPVAPNSNQVSVLAVRGVTLTPASPPVTSISPVSNPSSSGSPSPNAQQYSVIQRGPSSVSPVNNQERNFSPHVTTSVGGATNNPTNTMSPHNFAVPRQPPPRMQVQMQGQHSPQSQDVSFSINSSAERPDRPPTVDLTEDDVQAHTNQLRITSQQVHILQQQRQEQRRIQMVQNALNSRSTAAGPIGPRPVSCPTCSIACPSIQALEEHKLSSHGMRLPISSNSPNINNSRSSPGVNTAIRSSLQIRSMTPNQNIPQGSVPVRPPPQPNIRLQIPQQQIRSATSSPVNRPGLPGNATPPGKYLYIPLLDLSRMDANKLRRLDEIGISCVVPLHGNNSLSQMGIPIMNLRSEGMMSQHVPWDSVLPMGPVQAPVNNSNSNTHANTNHHPQPQQLANQHSSPRMNMNHPGARQI